MSKTETDNQTGDTMSKPTAPTDPTVVRQGRLESLKAAAGSTATEEHGNSPQRTTTVQASLNVTNAGDGKTTKDCAAVTVTIATTHEEMPDAPPAGKKKAGDATS
ncbi:MAG: hypothetical protein K2X93_26330 [Candidatus Obscuribacterales bacterium]|nr:hypothetical protein [Candidatus Obscuribacterales bacterium]